LRLRIAAALLAVLLGGWMANIEPVEATPANKCQQLKVGANHGSFFGYPVFKWHGSMYCPTPGNLGVLGYMQRYDWLNSRWGTVGNAGRGQDNPPTFETWQGYTTSSGFIQWPSTPPGWNLMRVTVAFSWETSKALLIWRLTSQVVGA
jgi:hypothetical protein